jgi:enamine deaminase RidA (YjgF/YER057c/UK114 family)
MGLDDIIKLNAYITRADLIPVYRAARDKAVGSAAPPASTLVVVAALANPAWVVEIECVAAKA